MLLLGLAVILQSSLAPFFHINNVHPNLVFVLVLAWSLLKDWQIAIAWAFLSGALLDIVSGVSFGTFSLGLMLTATLATFWQRRYFANVILPLLLTFPYSVLFSLSVLISLWLTGYSVNWSSVLTKIVFPESLMNVVVMALIFPLLLWLDKHEKRSNLTI